MFGRYSLDEKDRLELAKGEGWWWRGGIRFEAGFVAAFSFSGNFLEQLYSGVRLSVWLLLFVYYNLDTILYRSLRRADIFVPLSSSPLYSSSYSFSAVFRHRSVSLLRPILSLSHSACFSLSHRRAPTFALFLVPLVEHDTEHRTKSEKEGEYGVIRYAFVRARKRETEEPAKGKRNVHE